jgi:elongation factor G
MSVVPTSRIHSALLLGHSGVGKTTLVEAVLHSAGVTTRKGRVEDGSTVLGNEPEEIRHHGSLTLGVATFEYHDHRLHLIDTPGVPDFVGEAELALPIADLAVFVVSAVDGVQVQTETLWAAAAATRTPRMIFINKLDAERADFERTLGQCRELFGNGVAPLELPLYESNTFVGVADLLADVATMYRSGAPVHEPIPADIAELEHRVRDDLVEGIVVGDDALMERYLDGDVPSSAELEASLAKSVGDGSVFPVVCGSAESEVAIDRFVEFICEIATHRGVRASAADTEIEIAPDPQGPPLARVVKTTIDPFVGKIALLQVCSGTLRPDLIVVNSRTRAEERLHAMQYLQGHNSIPAAEAVAGDFVAIAKLTDASPGDTFAPKGTPVRIVHQTSMEPVMSIAIRPKTTGDEDKLMTALHRLQEEDTALWIRRDDETHQTVLSGMGELHLQVVLERLARKFSVEVEREAVKLPFRETISAPADAEGRYKKQSGGHGQFGVVHLRVEPLERGAGVVFEDRIVGGAIPRQFIPAVERGVRKALALGGAFGFPVIDVQVTLDDGKFHPVDSSEASFEQAGALACSEALRDAGPIPLEPISRLKVTVPATHLGEVLGDLNSRRARVASTEVGENGAQIVIALVPTIELTRYGLDLRALSGGYGSFHVEYDHYDVAPVQVAEHLAHADVLTS